MKYKHNLYGKSTLSPQQILTKFLYEAGKWKLLNCTNIYHELVFKKKKLVIRSGRFKVANRLSLSLSLSLSLFVELDINTLILVSLIVMPSTIEL